ncbi:hydrolase [Thermococcus sp. 21S9]|uniref:hydrolase n=1 Tax=Thermococcus sp. 21S9 TaxID=1638223 RepID=UPI0014390CCA|nr:hydrolase [Thermococcus sp. 21S9]NJE54617.1 hydrolase [Thermococcus sp. 21S9]
MRRGFVFTLDAVLALFLVLIMITAITTAESQVQSVYKTKMRMGELGDANAMLKLLRTVPLSQLVPADVVQKWENGPDPVINLTLVSPDMSPLEIAATYWAVSPLYPSQNYREKASIILGYILNSTLKGYNYELLINNWTDAFMSKGTYNYTLARDVSAATLVLSGYSYNQTPRGYVARAFLSKLREKVTSYVYQGDYIATKHGSRDIEITYIIPTSQFPVNSTVLNVTWYLEPAYTYSYYDVSLNGYSLDSCLPRYGLVDYGYEITSSSCPALATLVQDAVDNGSDSNFTVVVSKDYQVAGEDGAQHIIITYSTSQASTFKYPHYYYFADVKTYDSVYIEKYVFVPGNLTDLSIKLAGENIKSVTASIRVYGVDSRSFPLIDEGGYFVADNSTLASVVEGMGFNYSDLSGTYFTILFNVTWDGTGELHIDGRNSYVYADYIPFTAMSLYSVDVTQLINDYTVDPTTEYYNTGFYGDVQWDWNIPDYATPLYTTFQLPWLHIVGSNSPCEQKVSILMNATTNTWVKLYDAPVYNTFINAFARWGYTTVTRDYLGNPVENALHGGHNALHLQFGSCYYVSPEHALASVVYLLNAYAPYGNVKPYLMQGYPNVKAYNLTYAYNVSGVVRYGSIIVGDSTAIESGEYMNLTACDLKPDEYAVDDAILRLFNNLGGDGCTKPVLVDLGDTMINYVSLPGVPRSISPITVTLRVWRVGG